MKHSCAIECRKDCGPKPWMSIIKNPRKAAWSSKDIASKCFGEQHWHEMLAYCRETHNRSEVYREILPQAYFSYGSIYLLSLPSRRTAIVGINPFAKRPQSFSVGPPVASVRKEHFAVCRIHRSKGGTQNSTVLYNYLLLRTFSDGEPGSA